MVGLDSAALVAAVAESRQSDPIFPQDINKVLHIMQNREFKIRREKLSHYLKKKRKRMPSIVFTDEPAESRSLKFVLTVSDNCFHVLQMCSFLFHSDSHMLLHKTAALRLLD